MFTNIAHARNTTDAPHASNSLVYVIVEMVRDIFVLSSRCTEMVAVVDSWKPYSTTIWNTRQNDVANPITPNFSTLSTRDRYGRSNSPIR